VGFQTLSLAATPLLGEVLAQATDGAPVRNAGGQRLQFLDRPDLRNMFDEVPQGYQVDHIVPLSKGGADTPANMQLLSTPAHQAKTGAER
jgi:hypothetical protein